MGKKEKQSVQRSGRADLPCLVFSRNLLRIALCVNMSMEKHMEAVFLIGYVSCPIFLYTGVCAEW